MFSFIKNVITSLIPGDSGPTETNLEEEEEEEIINDLNEYLQGKEIPRDFIDHPKKLLGENHGLKLDIEGVRLFHKSGKVTHLCDKCGLIDDVVYFEPKQIGPDLDVKANDEVLYTAYKERENESERVFKVYALKNNSWDGKSDDKTSSEDNLKTVLPKVEILPALKRVITGRVTQRRGREVYVESADIWCNLDKIEVSYVPFEGDWVELTASVSLDSETADLTGDILHVESLKPLLMKSGFGRITLWSDITKEGAIENSIYFTNVSCEEGYTPAFGDEVVYDAIESDQERFKWRALKVLVNNNKTMEKLTENNSETTFESDLDDIFSDKNGIRITPSVCSIVVELNEAKIVTFKVTNNGKSKQLLKFTKFNLQKNSQLKLLKPKLTDYFYLRPNDSVFYVFECAGKVLGLSGEFFLFYFKNFTIAKRFEINVIGNKEMNQLLQCKFDTVFKLYRNSSLVRKGVKADVITYGPRPWKPPKFISKERKCVFKIPKKLWNLSTGTAQERKYFDAVMNYAPYLKSDLNFEFYTERFHTLLYLEEMEIRINFRKFDLQDVFLEREDDFFILTVPGLAERRPSVIMGDKVILTQPWLDEGKTKHIGFIYKIQAREVYIKFHGKMRETYDGSECNISFEPNVNFFSRCHDSVNRAVKVLGEKWLFPTAVNKKPPQINVNYSGETDIEGKSFETAPKIQNDSKSISDFNKVSDVESGTEVQSDVSDRVRNLVWVNKNLNERQKLAVVNVLRGEGRPLPYVIFGPPGTGKTVTLVEIIIQIYRLLPESRILITTPSNSSADLICERLIEMGNFRPGQLVRMLALYRVYEGLVPEKLIPYSSFFSPKENHGRNHSEINFKIKGSSFNELTGQHRITVATCTTIGILHYSGLLPGHFTHILVDEAGQTSEPEVLISATFQDVLKGQIILTGDPLQLGPVVCSNAAKKFGLGMSLLQRLISTFPYLMDDDGFPKTSGFDPRFITKLNVNYRSVPEILSLPSQMFYNADLIPTVSQTEGKEAEIIKKFNFQRENRTPAAIIFHGIVGQNYQEKDSPSWFNPHEIWQVVFYVRKLYSIGLNCESLGIVSPYAKQVQKLISLLPSLGLAVPKIGSVEEFQGQEREVIILTTVRSSPRYVQSDIVHSLGFVASPQRLNVALTRARALLIIVGNPLLLSKDPYWMNVVKYCKENDSYVGCSLEGFDEIVNEKEEDEESVTPEHTDDEKFDAADDDS